ncbi:hypothetical protein [uncultured Cellulomonas sp.]|uniref:hypothetical protein n=1 Tax=uncultured Cellulomonas sp. TaxID=189682 RepID=UPI0026154B5A|nr:hypothetical protein [uncultured Cellulomonas sp.]
MGLDTWHVGIGASFDPGAFTDALCEHVGDTLDNFDLSQVAAEHGVTLLEDEQPSAWVGGLEIITARYDDDHAAAAGRPVLTGGDDLLIAADDAAGDLIDLVAAIVTNEADRWSDEVPRCTPTPTSLTRSW